MPGMRYQPQGLARVSGSGIANGMVFSIQGGTGLRDIVRGAMQSGRGANQAVRAFPGGLAFDCRNVATAGYLSAADGVSQLVSDQTLIFDMIVSGAPAGSLPAFGGLWRSTAQNDAMLVLERPSADVVQVAFRIGGATSTRTFSAGLSALYGQRLIVSASIARGQTGRSVWLRIASEGRIIFDQETSYNAAGSSDVTPGGGEYISIGSEQIENPSRNPNCIIYSQHHFGRVVTADEVASLSRMPWQIYEDPEDEDDVGAAIDERRLSVDSAALVVAGGQVGMRVSRRLRADSAALAMVAGSTAMLATRRLRTDSAGLAIAAGSVSVRAARRLAVQPVSLTMLAGPTRMLVSRWFGVQPAALAVAGQGVTMRANRRLPVAPADLMFTGGQVSVRYTPAPSPGAYILPVSAASTALATGGIGARVARRLEALPAVFAVAGGAVRMTYTGEQEDIDAFLVPARHTVVFEGSRRVVTFEGAQRVVAFEGGKRVVSFEGSKRLVEFP